jgi:hypothetical protein
MSIVLELENLQNWQIRDSQFFTTILPAPLPEYISAWNFTSTIIAVLIDNSEARETWNWAGSICQKINLPFGPSSNSYSAYQPLRLRQKQLVIFPRLVPAYEIAIQFPKWFTRASVTIWEYTGPTDDTEIQLSQIQTKLDSLLSRPP